MIETPHITQSKAHETAVIHVTIPRSEIQSVMDAGIPELMATITAQGVKPAGPVYSHHLSMHPDIFDFEIGVPVSSPVSARGRVKPGKLPGVRVAQTVYQGNYDGLGNGWHEFMAWIKDQGLESTPDLWEVYVKGPESDPDPSTWRTELNQPLLG